MIPFGFHFIFFFTISLFISFLVCGFLIKNTYLLRAFDKPDGGRKLQSRPVSFLGGTAIGTTLVIVFSLSEALDSKVLWPDNLLFWLLFTGCIIFAVGLFDDFLGLSPQLRLGVQIIVGILISIFMEREGLGVQVTAYEFINVFMSVLWIVGICNAFNLYDNSDMSAGGAISMASIGILLIAIQNGQNFLSFISLVLLGAVLGFIVWNRPPAKIYLGDSGALTIGTLVAVQTIQLRPETSHGWTSILAPLFIVAMPMMDTLMVITSRVLRGISPLTAGRDHIYHRLAALDLPSWRITIIMAGGSLYFVALAVVLNSGVGVWEAPLAIFGLASWLLIAFTIWKKCPSPP